MVKELRKFLIKFPYLPRPRNIKEEVEVLSKRTTLLFIFLSFLPWWWPALLFFPLPFLSSSLAGPCNLMEFEDGRILAWRRRRERKHPLELGGGGRITSIHGIFVVAESCLEKKVA